MMVQRFRLPRRKTASAMTAVLLTATALTAPAVTAQTTYTCFPTCSTTDGRFLSLAGTGIDAFAGNDITIGLGLPPNATTLEIGIFDGESSGNWDKGTYPLTYKLYADKNGDGTGAVLLDSISGSVMTDNGWYTYTRAVTSTETATNGNHVYYLHISMPTTASGSTSSFKLRTNGTITVRSYQSFSIHAPIYTVSDASTIYPNYTLGATSPIRYDNPTYNGIWNIYLDVLSPSSELTIWDGDMDHGTDVLMPNAPNPLPVDTDDEDTPAEIPSWAVPAPLTSPEGAAGASPFDDNKSPLNRRSPAVRYDVIFPNSTSYANENPSGSVEWEQFKISTAPMSRPSMDAHADSIPAGIYTVRVEGMDMLNVNSWRFFNDVVAAPGTSNVEVIGVNETGLPVAPIRAIETVSGSISGTIYYDSNEDSTQSVGEPGLPTVAVRCYKRNTDGAWSEHSMKGTTIDGNFTFAKLPAGEYKVEVESQSLQSDVLPTCDADGTTTVNNAEVAVSANTPNIVASFGYKRSADVGTLTRGYWVNHPEDWLASELRIGGRLLQQDSLIRILQRPTRGDKSYSMAAQLIATKLNLLTGTDASCIGTEVGDADTWLATHWLGRGRTPDEEWVLVAGIHDQLDDYNNGRLCENHMD
jgi:hypothetical protein